VRFVVFCLLVVDRKIIAFEEYRPFVGIIWEEIMSRDFFFLPSESFVAFLNDTRTVSSKYVERMNGSSKCLTAMINKVC